jgi:hypothetical protein
MKKPYQLPWMPFYQSVGVMSKPCLAMVLSDFRRETYVRFPLRLLCNQMAKTIVTLDTSIYVGKIHYLLLFLNQLNVITLR